ncbi:hypothetical protein [uncultured Parabacteroides sp.]|uniref:hypothetical protein n=1 Tax=uncultured Parabacteroides sp. TaxID=512312 RepID=UPI00259A195A|nr:hypothetical protein [uncultured Parabacteroides sp.]
MINTAEQFDLCGDIEWLKSHKAGCEKALDWLIRRDSNGNGIFEMMNNSIVSGPYGPQLRNGTLCDI